MYNDYANTIKETLNAYQVFRRYGFKVYNGGFVRCPFHSGGNERTGSLKLYDGRRGWCCFACGAGGSIIDFVMQYFDLPFKEACKKLNDDFGLGLPIDTELTEAERKRISREAYELRKKRKAYENRRKMLYTAYYAAFDRYASLDKVLLENGIDASRKADVNPFDLSDDALYAFKHIDAAKYNLDEAEDALRLFEAQERAM